jgi:hypothetical protein
MSFRFQELMVNTMVACPNPSLTGLCPAPSKMWACPNPSLTGLCPAPSKMLTPKADAAMPLALLKAQLRQQLQA